jgi:hypothetical protein
VDFTQGFHLSENKYTKKLKKIDKFDKNPANENNFIEILNKHSTLGPGVEIHETCQKVCLKFDKNSINSRSSYPAINFLILS